MSKLSEMWAYNEWPEVSLNGTILNESCRKKLHEDEEEDEEFEGDDFVLEVKSALDYLIPEDDEEFDRHQLIDAVVAYFSDEADREYMLSLLTPAEQEEVAEEPAEEIEIEEEEIEEAFDGREATYHDPKFEKQYPQVFSKLVSPSMADKYDQAFVGGRYGLSKEVANRLGFTKLITQNTDARSIGDFEQIWGRDLLAKKKKEEGLFLPDLNLNLDAHNFGGSGNDVSVLSPGKVLGESKKEEGLLTPEVNLDLDLHDFGGQNNNVGVLGR